MYVIEATNVNHALQQGLSLLDDFGIQRESRNGTVTLMDAPVTTIYQNPMERVMTNPFRDANPFFHFMEGLWMLAGRDDVEWVSRFNSSIAQFSDDGVSFHGAYGKRWSGHFLQEVYIETPDNEPPDGEEYITVMDQLAIATQMLRDNSDDRRVVVSMWDAPIDLARVGKDIPCNLQILFSISVYGTLDMTITNRSNDIIWGAYGANAVHFSMMMEVMAEWVGVPVGRYYQMSNNFHGYDATFLRHRPLIKSGVGDPYQTHGVKPYPMVHGTVDDWFKDLHLFMVDMEDGQYTDKFFRRVAAPMAMVWREWKRKGDNNEHVDRALEGCKSISATDWRMACEEWLERRRK